LLFESCSLLTTPDCTILAHPVPWPRYRRLLMAYSVSWLCCRRLMMPSRRRVLTTHSRLVLLLTGWVQCRRRRHLMSNANFPRTRTRLCFSFVALEYSKLAAEFEESMVC
jgi:hypothetical protein